MLTASLLIAQSAKKRRESRGVHYRRDFPEIDDEHYKEHIELNLKLTIFYPCKESIKNNVGLTTEKQTYYSFV